jgi:hypothetical protein
LPRHSRHIATFIAEHGRQDWRQFFAAGNGDAYCSACSAPAAHRLLEKGAGQGAAGGTFASRRSIETWPDATQREARSVLFGAE